jgi:hypothetical protein
MTKKIEHKEYKLQIKNIEILDVVIEHPKEPIKDAIYNYDINIQHKSNRKDNILFAILDIQIYNKDKKRRLGKITTSCIFEIIDLQNIIKINGSTIDMPSDLMSIINSVSISTTRGVMFSLFKGTFLHNAILPLIDPTSFTRNK